MLVQVTIASSALRSHLSYLKNEHRKECAIIMITSLIFSTIAYNLMPKETANSKNKKSKIEKFLGCSFIGTTITVIGTRILFPQVFSKLFTRSSPSVDGIPDLIKELMGE